MLNRKLENPRLGSCRPPNSHSSLCTAEAKIFEQGAWVLLLSESLDSPALPAQGILGGQVMRGSSREVGGQGLSGQFGGTAQRAQYPLKKEYTLNYRGVNKGHWAL